MFHLRQLQRSHDGSEAEQVAQGGLQFRGDLDDFMKQSSPLLSRTRAAQQVDRKHSGHGLKPAGTQKTQASCQQETIN